MTIQDFKNIYSYHKITAEVFEYVYFGNYLRISVSIGTSAKCRLYAFMLLKADALFFKTKVIYSLDMLSSFILCYFCVQKLKKQMCIQENGNYSCAAYCILRSTKKKFSGLQQFKL